MLFVIAYTRVSTKEQARDGHSLDGQRLQLKEFAKAKGLKIQKWFSDDTSARNEEEGSERSGLKAARDLALKKDYPILVTDASRFARTEETYDRFIAQGGKVYGLDGFGADEALMRAKIKGAKFDGDRRSKTTKEGQAKAKAAGKKFGTRSPMNGARASAVSRGKDADIRRRELERLRELAAEDGVTAPTVFSDWLNGKGHRTAQGKPWTPENVRKKLTELSGPKPAREPPASTEAPMITLTPDELDLARRVIKVAKIAAAQRDSSLKDIHEPMTQERKDAFMKKVHKLYAKALEYIDNVRRNPDWGRF